MLSNVSIRIEPGQVAAFVGPSGAGKTTMVSLVPRFYDPVSGSVRIDGVDVRDYTLKSLRDQISFVLQDTLLFRATIWDNIAYGRPDADPEDTVRAATLANAHDFIMDAAAGLRDDGRRPRHVALGRAAPAHRHRPRHRARHAAS